MSKKFLPLMAGGLILIIAILFPVLYLLGNMALSPVHKTHNKNSYVNIIDNRDEHFSSRWNINNIVFPHELSAEMKEVSFLRAYCAPLDSTEMAWLVVDYPKDRYKEEIDRLEKIGSTEYIGHYGIVGFDFYKVVTISVDSRGITYALTDGVAQICYFNLSFFNGYSDIDYEKYVEKKYLPIGFDAITPNNY